MGSSISRGERGVLACGRQSLFLIRVVRMTGHVGSPWDADGSHRRPAWSGLRCDVRCDVGRTWVRLPRSRSGRCIREHHTRNAYLTLNLSFATVAAPTTDLRVSVGEKATGPPHKRRSNMQPSPGKRTVSRNGPGRLDGKTLLRVHG